MTIEIYKNLYNEDFVAITNEDKSVSSMPKSVYDELIAKQEGAN